MSLSPTMILAVAAGGAVGAVARYLTGAAMTQLLGYGWPYGTFVVNIIGSLVMGMLVEAMALVWSPSAEMRVLLMTGVLGGFYYFFDFFAGCRDPVAAGATGMGGALCGGVGGFGHWQSVARDAVDAWGIG